MAPLPHLLELLLTVPDFISGCGALRLHGPRASSSRSQPTVMRSSSPEKRRGSHHGVAASQTGAESRLKPTPNPFPPAIPARAAALAVCAACLTPPLARCAQVMRVDAGAALHSFYLEPGGHLGLHRQLLAALRTAPRQGFGRGGRSGKRRGPDGDPGRM